MDFQDSSWNISVFSLAILAPHRFLICHAENRQIRRQTELKTLKILATAVGVDSKS